MATEHNGSALDSMLNKPESSALKESSGTASPPTLARKATVIGLYGIPGSGKTTLMSELKGELGQQYFAFYEGSEMIDNIVPGGLGAFQTLAEEEKKQWRQRAITTIGTECTHNGLVGVVAGHFMFWAEEEEFGQPVLTQGDLDTYTHILYLDVSAEVVSQRRLHDTGRSRSQVSVNHLQRWQQCEKDQLRSLCRQHRILFSHAFSSAAILEQVSLLMADFSQHTVEFNLSCAVSKLDEVLANKKSLIKTVLMLDADRTLAADDTGALLWKTALTSGALRSDENALKTLFDSALGYSYTAFRQATLLYEEISDDSVFDSLCEEVAAVVALYPEFKALLQRVAEEPHTYAVIVTCGVCRIWDKIMAREGLSDAVQVIGGGRIANGFVVTPEVKQALVVHLRESYGACVWAFGDSPLDLGMMRAADEAIVVVGDERTRSRSMEAALAKAIDHGGLRACQVLLPSHVPPRLDASKLPVVRLTDKELLSAILRHSDQHAGIHVLHATDKCAAKLLMTPMRDATVEGHALREAHRRVGWYLAVEFLSNLIGTEEHQIRHVQGHHTSGFRLLSERRTVIVPLMRGGEAMAFGVSEAFPLAMFVHASTPEELRHEHLSGRSAVVLVDSVVNSGKSVMEFVQHIRSISKAIRVVVVAGVVQAQAITEGGFIAAMSRYSELSIIALRLSDNKFTGSGGTDTGNRLFNTTHLP